MKKVVLFITAIILILSGYLFYINFSNESVETLSKYGSSGEEVRKIQQKLKNWGYYTGSVDRNIWKQNTSSCKKISEGK